ncbi:MAG TPA: hypothetical protein VGQ36_28270 [Thermoanaerobaculia bacterium]|nr:hypothetical protein [Thermoanaerobaculia bacterium]
MAEKKTRLAAMHLALSLLEKRRSSRIYAIINTGSGEHLCAPTLRTLFKNRKKFQNIETLEVLLHSPGGHAEIAYSTIKFLRKHCKRLNVLVPMYAKSAATLMCLGADTIFMGEFAELGPLDVQITDVYDRGQAPFSPLDEFKSMEFLREYATELLNYFSTLMIGIAGMSVKEAIHEAIPAVTGLMAPLYQRVDPSKVGGYRRSLAVGEDYAVRLLRQRGIKKADEIVEKLVWGYPSHSFVIDMEEAAGLGLPVVQLPASQEEILLNVVLGASEHGLSFYGFAEAQPKVATAKTKAKKRARRRPVPAEPKDGDRPRAIAGS